MQPRVASYDERSRTARIAAFLIAAAAAPGLALAAPAATWTPIGPPGGRVQALAVTAAGTVIAGTGDGGIFRSTNAAAAAAAWSPSSLLDVAMQHQVLAVVPSPADAQTVFAATGTLWRSSDGGGSWSQLGSAPIIAVAICAAAPQTLYAVSHQQVYRSDDGGATLRQLTGDLPEPQSYINLTVAVDPADPDTAYAGTNGGIFKTTDGGVTWAFAGPAEDVVEALVADPARPGTLYTWLQADHLLVTHDGGETWTPITVNIQVPAGLAVVPSPGSPSRLYLAGTYVPCCTPGGPFDSFLLRSDDGGSTWAQLLATEPIDAVAVDPLDPARIYAGVARAGVLRTTDGGASWARVVTGLDATPVNAVTADPHTPNLLYAATGLDTSDLGIEASLDAGATWVRHDQGLGAGITASRVIADPGQAGLLYAALLPVNSAETGAARSSDGGITWQLLPLDIFANDLAVDPVRPQTLYAVGTAYIQPPNCPPDDCPSTAVLRASRSGNGGKSWIPIEGRFGLVNVPGSFTAVRIDPRDHQTVYVTGDRTYKSTDDGATWIPLPLGPGIADLAVDGRRHLYAADPLHDAVDVSTDGGLTWAPGSVPLPAGAAPRSLALVRPGTLYCGAGDGGVFSSSDFGQSWTPLGTGLPALAVTSVILDPFHAGTVYAATAGRGVFSLNVP